MALPFNNWLQLIDLIRCLQKRWWVSRQTLAMHSSSLVQVQVHVLLVRRLHRTWPVAHNKQNSLVLRFCLKLYDRRCLIEMQVEKSMLWDCKWVTPIFRDLLRSGVSERRLLAERSREREVMSDVNETSSRRYWGLCPVLTRCINEHSFKMMHCSNGNQCSSCNVDDTWTKSTDHVNVNQY